MKKLTALMMMGVMAVSVFITVFGGIYFLYLLLREGRRA